MAALITIEAPRAAAVLIPVLENSAARIPLRCAVAERLGSIDRPGGAGSSGPNFDRGARAVADGDRKRSLVLGRPGAEALLGVLEAGRASPQVLQDRDVQSRWDRLGIAGAPERIAALLKGIPPADSQMKQLLDERLNAFAKSSRNVAHGAEVFAQHCAACHTLEGRGTRVGPALDGVGKRGLERVIEDVLDPNRNVDPAYRRTTLARTDGRVAEGLLLREDAGVLVLADSQGRELRVPRNEVAERNLSPLPLMPSDFAARIPEPDFHDLVAFLLDPRSAPRDPAARPK